MEVNRIINADVLAALSQLPSESVNCCVTSPPYFGLRDYGVDGQIGLEKTPAQFVARLVDVFREVRRVMRDDGTLWLNLGDSYSAQAGQRKVTDVAGIKQQSNVASVGAPSRCAEGCKPKDLIGIPWMVAFALRDDGWYLRQDIIWHKPNAMPESVQDRCTKAHEFIFMLSKKPKYYYDGNAIKVPASLSSEKRWSQDVESQAGSVRANGGAKSNGNMKAVGGPKTDKQRGHSRRHDGFNNRWDAMEKAEQCSGMVNKRSVWRVATSRYKDAHFATFPPELITPCILAGCPAGGVVLDPFGGSGTTAQVAKHLGRDWVIIELNTAYCELAKARINTPLKETKPRNRRKKIASQKTLFD